MKTRAVGQAHGTNAAWARHRRRGERPCRPCMDARSAYEREARSGPRGAARRAELVALEALKHRHPGQFRHLYEAEKPPSEGRRSAAGEAHGTYGSWAQHQRRGETPCDACRAARNEYQRKWTATLARARRAALDGLAERYSGEYEGLYEAALRQELDACLAVAA